MNGRIARLLIANRGEIARRVMRTARARGIECVVPVCEADAGLPHVAEADLAVAVPSPRSFLDAELLTTLATECGADAVHPGYGFLSESARFARRVADAGLVWIGPDASTIAEMGDKAVARATMRAAGVPIVPGSDGPVREAAEALSVAERIGFPLIVKPAAGGGGIGMRVVHAPDELGPAIQTARSRGRAAFSDDALVIERFIRRARHVEVQIVGLPSGEVLAFAERDCSVQRRHQKVIEESPSPGVDERLRDRLRRAAVAAAEAVGYRNAGTVEFILDTETGQFAFLEMNTRLQVEHGVTELVHGVDLVAAQLDIAEGREPDGLASAAAGIRGHAVEARVYAEDPVTFRPRAGRIERWVEPSGAHVRVDAGYHAGTTIGPYFDPMLGKVLAWGEDRTAAVGRLRDAIEAFEIDAPSVNLTLLSAVLGDPAFERGDADTRFLDRFQLPRG
ncbi:acetyl-CoA carboxylase biotin carboxylase subunit [Jiangella anatolica]|uniref:Biotin carboxylase n=1 Tax=Jiangella anatolica TaxID=2670374 RepID=A0A2W2B4L3_9ACTN|nr:biotin carboxylase N-terminal domain-containing protein [Jiangella anatolica]PZF82351.1 biotin carboxylase [Jiangella anatolica]